MSTTDTFYADAADGQISKSGAVWATQRAAATGDSRDKTSATVNATQVQEFTGTYYIDRGFLTFDTSTIPDTATITAATLYIYANSKSSSGLSDSLCIVESTQASGTDLTTADFDAVGSTELATRVAHSSISTAAYTSLALNSSGLAVISKTGFSKFALRSAKDFDNSAPSAGTYAILNINCSEQTATSKDPYLEVTYDIFQTKTFTADAIIKQEATKTFTADAIVLPDRWADTCTGSDSTNLEDHTPTGPYGGAAASGTWTQWYPTAGFARLRITSNKLYSYTSAAIATTSEYRHSQQFTDAQWSADFSIPGSHNDGGYGVLSLRHAGSTPGTSSGYQVYFSNGGYITAGTVRMEKIVSGTSTVLGSAYTIGTLSNASTYRVALVVNGDQISVKLNGVTVIGPVTDTAITARGYVHLGLYTLDGSSTSVGVQVDNLLLEPAPSQPTATFTADAIVAAAVGVATFTADGIVFGTSTKTFTADGIVVTSASKTFTADAVVNGISRGTQGARANNGSATTIFTGGSIGTFGAHYAFPDGATLRDGTNVIVARKGTSHSSYDGDIVVKTRAPGGAWGSEATLFNNASYDERDPDLYVLPSSGRLVMAWQRRYVSGDDRFKPMFAYCDGDPSVAANWSTPVQVTTGGSQAEWTVASDITELSGGTLLCATYGTPTLPWTIDRCDISKSVDGGATWTYVGTLDDGSGHPSYGAAEPQLEVREDGKVFAIYRTVNSPWETWARVSTDNGVTWGSEYRILTSSINRTGLTIGPDGDYIAAYSDSFVLKFVQSWDRGATFGSAVSTTRAVNVWSSPFQIGGAGVTPNVAITYGNENGAQTQSSVYYQELTASGSVYVERTATVTADALIVSGVTTQGTRTFTADAIIQSQGLTATFTADAIVSEAVAGLQTRTKTFTADAVINVTPDATFASGSTFYSAVGQDLHFWAVQ